MIESETRAMEMNRRRTGRVAISVTLAGLFGASAFCAQVPLKPGQYAMTVTYQVQNERQNQMRSGTRCVTASDLENPEAIFSDEITRLQTDETKCSVGNWKNTGGRISYDAECSNRTVHVEGSLSETQFSVVRTVTPKTSPKVLLKFFVTGRRTGDCKAAVGTGFEDDAFTR